VHSENCPSHSVTPQVCVKLNPPRPHYWPFDQSAIVNRAAISIHCNGSLTDLLSHTNLSLDHLLLATSPNLGTNCDISITFNMSTEVAASGAAPPASLDKNAQAAEDAKKMLAELQGGTTAETGAANTSKEKLNGDVQEAKHTVEEKSLEEPSKDRSEEEESERKNDRRDRDDRRSSRGGRGRGGYQARNYRDNIKSDLTTQEESSDPVAIRKQVKHDCFGV
jgi:hypothetical protein